MLNKSTRTIREHYNRLHYKRFKQRLEAARGDEKFVFRDKLNTKWHQIAREFLSLLSIRNKHVLEVGCGYGSFSVYMAELGGNVAAVDVSSEAIRLSKRNAQLFKQDVLFKEASATNLPFNNKEFDIVVCCDTLEHIPQYKGAIEEIVRVTKNGGKIIITTPNILNPRGIYLKLITNQPVEHAFCYWSIPSLLKEKGIKVVDIKSKEFFGDFDTKKIEHFLSHSFLKIFGLRVGILGIKPLSHR